MKDKCYHRLVPQWAVSSICRWWKGQPQISDQSKFLSVWMHSSPSYSGRGGDVCQGARARDQSYYCCCRNGSPSAGGSPWWRRCRLLVCQSNRVLMDGCPLAIVQMPPGTIPVATVAVSNGFAQWSIMIATGKTQVTDPVQEELKGKIVDANKELAKVKYPFKTSSEF